MGCSMYRRLGQTGENSIEAPGSNFVGSLNTARYSVNGVRHACKEMPRNYAMVKLDYIGYAGHHPRPPYRVPPRQPHCRLDSDDCGECGGLLLSCSRASFGCTVRRVDVEQSAVHSCIVGNPYLTELGKVCPSAPNRQRMAT